MVNTVRENTEINGQASENKEYNGQASKASLKFKEKINDKKGFNVEDAIDAIKIAIVDVIELEITTWVPEPSNQLDNEPQNEQEIAKPGNRMYTVINLIDGTITNEVGNQFIGTGPYAELREFHLSQVKESREIIKKNIESVQKLYEILIEVLKSRKNSQQSTINKP
ncbi:hypothetical protein [Nostoc sp. MG11]|uniref:hypothetical protein n=1 Tax=Nostoc sp. MG11 TaxID=2721166 RepID=UPI001D023CA5|nr:hypothetical protein [Nostoc sp. MG11]